MHQLRYLLYTLSFFLFIAGMRTMYDTGELMLDPYPTTMFTLKLSPEVVARVGNHFVTQIL